MKPRIGIFGLAGCWGEQIVILNCEDGLLDLVGAVEIVDFLGGSSENDEEGPLDIALVEGSVCSAREEQALRRIRDRSRLLVACGSCACFGGVAGMDAALQRGELTSLVYGEAGKGFDARGHQPLHRYVAVDYALVGCPMEKGEFLAAVSHLLQGDLPLPRTTPVCHECKANELPCLLVARALLCAGVVTTGGCGARCPSHAIPCIGCRGPLQEANLDSLRDILVEKGIDEQVVQKKLRTFAAPVMGWPGATGE